MSFDMSFINYNARSHLKTVIEVPPTHFLIKLAEGIPWQEFALLAKEDLYRDKKMSGKKLNIKLHLGAFLLQTLFRWSDRELEENIKFYSPAQIFCGISNKASPYDHSAYVKFRNRLSDETVKKLNASLLKRAIGRGFTGTQFIDVDSTVQEANIEYPADIRMMQSLIKKGVKILKGLSEAGSTKARSLLKKIDLKKIGKDFKGYFFAKKSADGFEEKVKIFSKAHATANDVLSSIDKIKGLIKNYILPWNYQRDFDQVTKVGKILLKQINYFIEHGEVAKGKILSLHAKEVKCIAKGKTGKPYEFGRKFFIMRFPGNYVQAFTDNDFALEDAASLEKVVNEYKKITGTVPDSISGDSAFWSPKNFKACKDINEVGIAPKGNQDWKVAKEKVEELKTRRAKVEPIIGHLKKRGMGRSKMKSDAMTRLDGQRSALSLNMSRLARDLSEEELEWAG